LELHACPAVHAVDRSGVEPLCQYDLVRLVSRPSVAS
jgi:hypothetical protein